MWQIKVDEHNPWISVQSNSRAILISQGWKIHVSATITSAEQVLERSLEVLLPTRCNFKCAKSVAALAEINEGNGGLSQVGKFITVYPESDNQAVALALELHRATAGLQGPRVLSDRRFNEGSNVYYRYGVFDDQHMQTAHGLVVPALRDPTGQLIADQRLPRYVQPDWVSDPFLVAGSRQAQPNRRDRLLASQYLLVSTISRSARGDVYLAIDTEARETRIIKHAYVHGVIGPDGRDARSMLRHEADAIATLASSDCVPRVYDFFLHRDDAYLVMEDIEGTTLDEHIRSLSNSGCYLEEAAVRQLCVQIAQVLSICHASGMVYRDVKSSNVILTPDNQVRLIDFELVANVGDQTISGQGTRGYMSPQQQEGARASISDDIYGFGALTYYMATGAEPSLAPDSSNLLTRPVELLNPDVTPSLAALIERCLNLHFGSMSEVISALTSPAIRRPLTRDRFSDINEPGRSRNYMQVARALGDGICKSGVWVTGDEVAWNSQEVGGGQILWRDLNTGTAGNVFALTELVAEFGKPWHKVTLASAANWLAKDRTEPVHREGGAALPGLYVGEAGVGLALLQAGRVLGERRFVDRSFEISHWVMSQPYDSPDIFNGAAGRLLFHLATYEETRELVHLEGGLEAGEFLLRSAVRDKTGVYWPMPDGFGGLSGQAFLGYAHGAAGIGDALLQLHSLHPDARYLECVRHAASWLISLACPALNDGSGRAWPATEREPPSAAFWCHGAGGVGRFLLHASAAGIPETGEFARRAALAIIRGSRWIGAGLCHGLAGNADFVATMWQATHDARFLRELDVFGSLLKAFLCKRGDVMVAISDVPDEPSPGLLVGYSGIASSFLKIGKCLGEIGGAAGSSSAMPDSG